MTRALYDAAAHLRLALDRWPAASSNLHGTVTPSSAGLLDGGAQGGYPTGHTGSARMECDCRSHGLPAARACKRCGLNTDAARAALVSLDRDLLAIIRLCCELLDVEV